MSLDRCGDPGWVRHCLHISLARLREPPTPIFHPEHEARGECSPFKFQSASITPVSYSKNIWSVPPIPCCPPPTSLYPWLFWPACLCAYRLEEASS